MHLGKDLVDRATLAQHERGAHQESVRVVREILRTYNCSLQRPGEAQHVARTRHAGGEPACAPEARRPAAELRR